MTCRCQQWHPRWHPRNVLMACETLPESWWCGLAPQFACLCCTPCLNSHLPMKQPKGGLPDCLDADSLYAASWRDQSWLYQSWCIVQPSPKIACPIPAAPLPSRALHCRRGTDAAAPPKGRIYRQTASIKQKGNRSTSDNRIKLILINVMGLPEKARLPVAVMAL